MHFWQLSLISLVIVVLSGCGPSAFERCLSAETQKLVQAHEESLTPQLLELRGSLPAFERGIADRPRWQKLLDAETLFDKEYSGDLLEKDKAFIEAYPDVFWDDQEAQALASGKVYTAVYSGVLDSSDEKFEEKYEALCEIKKDYDPHCLTGEDLILAAIKNRVEHPDFKPEATEVCHSRGVY